LFFAEKIRHIVENHTFKKESVLIYKTISGGIYHSDIDSSIKTYKSIYKLADIALYKAKESGRNRIVLAQEEIYTYKDIDEEHKCVFIFEDRSLQKIINANGPIFEITGYIVYAAT